MLLKLKTTVGVLLAMAEIFGERFGAAGERALDTEAVGYALMIGAIVTLGALVVAGLIP